MKVFDSLNNKEIEVSDIDIPAVVKNPVYKLPSKDFEFEDESGIRRIVNAKDFTKALDSGYKYIPQTQVEKEELVNEAASKPIQASLVAAARGATLGATDIALTQAGIYTPEELSALEKGNPALSTTFDIGGTLATSVLSGGTGAVANVAKFAPAAIADLVAKKAAVKLGGKLAAKTTSNIAKKAAEMAVGSSVDAALFGTGRLITEDAMGDAEFNAESLLGSVGQNLTTGFALGGLGGATFKAGEKAINKSMQTVVKKLDDFSKSGDVGILKKLGAKSADFKKILKTASLDEKELIDYALDVSKGFSDTADDILLNKGITRTGGKSFLKTATSSLEDFQQNNMVAKEGAGKLMNSALTELDEAFEKGIINNSIKEEQKVYGFTLAERIEKEILSDLEEIYSPRTKPIKDMVRELKELGVRRTEDGAEISIKPLSPSQLKAQSIEFGKLANWAATDDKGKQQVYKDLRSFLEQKLEEGMASLPDGKSVIEKYKTGKKLYQKAATLESIIEKGMIAEYANNRGFSLTESVLTGAGAAAAGVPGAIAAYALRRGQREYGDIALTYAMKKIENSSNKFKMGISDAVEGFFKKSLKASNKAITGSDVSNEKIKETEDKVKFYSQDPTVLIEKFVEQNEDFISSAPKTSEAFQNQMIKAIDFLQSKIPRRKESIFGDEQISRAELLKFRNYIDAIEKPNEMLDLIKSGYIMPESIEAMKVVYPKIFNAIKEEFIHRIPEFKNITEKQKADLSRILEIDSRKAYTPSGMQLLQQVSAQGVARDLNNNKKVPVTAARDFKASQRSQTGLDKTLYRS